ncbi:ABC transporter permease [Solibacillus merdavium]|uniref:ABC transporter permease subunit n=1 Tax=Solibacillus merdavium TaxID=2762218 RepID=A0ABR8XQT1_9BACL|nr:ABC transporter permease subunit [Solibacillus merdavium]MBD8034303.1 ABC transporter permease subunit [Solibacillus merdavium]
MQQFKALFLKEWRESVRSFKLLWIPLVFILLGISDPIMNYFMEDILKAVGNMPEGFMMTLPEFQPADLLMASTGQFQSIGLLVLIAAYIGVFSRERQNGTATLIYVRPVSFTAMYASKWMVASIIAMISAIAGYAGSMYYTALLYGTVDWMKFFAMLGTYCLWLLFVMAVTVAMSAAFNTSIAAAVTIVIISLGLFIDSLFGGFWSVTPWKLANYGIALLTDSVLLKTYWLTVLMVVGLTILSIVLGIVMSRKNMRQLKI